MIRRRNLSYSTLFSFLVFSISSSIHAAPAELHVVGNQVLTLNGGCTVRLRGVDIAGMEWSKTGPEFPPQGINTSVLAAITLWKCNIVRIPMSQDYWFGIDGAKDYRQRVDRIIQIASANNAYVDLDLHWSGTGRWGTTAKAKQQDMPDDHSLAFWKDVATRYKNNPGVLFGLYNEPKEDSWDVWRNGGMSNSGFHTPGLQALLNTVRATGANNVVLVGGLDWAYDLTGLVENKCGDGAQTCGLTDIPAGHGIIYDAHVYPFKTKPDWQPYNGDEKITVAAAKYPIMIGEFGNDKHDGGKWVRTLLDWVDEHHYHAMAWDWTDCGPKLTLDEKFTPNSWEGVPVKNWLATPVPMSCPPAKTP